MKNNKETSGIYNNMTNLYGLTKTIRFELKPQYETLQHIKENEVVEKDLNKLEYVQISKKIFDRMLRDIIERDLKTFKFSEEDLKEYMHILDEKPINLKKQKELSKKLQVKIENHFKNSDEIKLETAKIFSENVLKHYCFNPEEIRAIEETNKFTTYIKKFHENRKNIFKEDGKETSIGYRIVEDNLPIYINNLNGLLNFLESVDVEFILKVHEEFKKMGINQAIKEIFKLSNFNLFLNQSGIEMYNMLIGGRFDKNSAKIKGLNELLNEYSQQNDKVKTPKLKLLNKQILSDVQTKSFVIDTIQNDTELIEILFAIREAYNNTSTLNYENVFDLFKNLKEDSYNNIFIENNKLRKVSHEVFGNFNYINELIYIYIDEQSINKKDRENYLKEGKTIGDLLQIMKNKEEREKIINWLLDFKTNKDIKKDYFKEISNFEVELFSYIKNFDLTDSNIKENEEFKEKIKKYIDSIKSLELHLKSFDTNNLNIKMNNNFYFEFDKFYEMVSKIDKTYDKVRNYLTQKAFNTGKNNLFFSNPTFLTGWSKSKESDNLGVIFEKNGNFYLGIINKEIKKKSQLFEEESFCEYDKKNCYKKYDVFMLSNTKRDFPKVFFSKSFTENRINHKIEEGYGLKKYKEDSKYYDKEFKYELIDYYKHSLTQYPDWDVFDFQMKSTRNYSSVNEFLEDIQLQSYKFVGRDIPEDYIKNLVSQNQLYLFQIYNKDFSPYSKGKENLHTIYFKALFDEKNFDKYDYKLSANAEMFYRPASIKKENITIHPKGKIINNKNSKNDTKSIFEYDIIKDKRYTEDKFLLHLPIEMNRTTIKPLLNKELNQLINKNIKNTKTNYVLGIDRGERHLIYMVLIDSDGNIIKQKTLNTITNEYKDREERTNSVETNYRELLDFREKERQKARVNWQEIGKIKDLKEGYLSQVVNEIVKMIEEYQPIIVLENLNSGFKNSRKKVEKQVYQKFEKNLMKKLQYITIKDKSPNELFGIYRSLQITPKDQQDKFVSSQSGAIYYIPAAYTSNIDPITGFTPFIKTTYISVEKSKKLLKTFEDIYYDETKDLFVFIADYKKFNIDRKMWNKQIWEITTYGERIKNEKHDNHWESVEVNLTDEFKRFFEESGIDYKNRLKEQLANQNNGDFYKKLLYYIRLMQQLRNSHINSEIDYILSPVSNKEGVFFDSRNNIDYLPKNADANGAYNIARKGLIVIDKIKEEKDKICSITNEEWLKFIEKSNM